jgi:triphosphatase
VGLVIVADEADAGPAQAVSVPVAGVSGISAEAALRRIVADCRTDIAAQRAAVMASEDPSSIHQIRVALRRLRAALDVFCSAVEDQREVRSIDAQARRLARAFAPARDLQVFLLETAPDAPSEISEIGRKLVQRRVGQARAVLAGARFAEFDQRLARFAAAHPRTCGETLTVFARRVLDRSEAKVRRRGRGLAHLKVSELHHLRIAAKKLRYTVSFLAPAFQSDAAEGYSKVAVGLQDALGVINDRTVGTQVLADIARTRRSSRKVKRSCDRLSRRLSHPSSRHKKQLKHAWKAFKKSQPFWR